MVFFSSPNALFAKSRNPHLDMLTVAKNRLDAQLSVNLFDRSRPVTVELSRGNVLSDEMLNRWNNICDAEPRLASGYFRPGFYQAVCRVRDDVEVAVLRQCGSIIGFWPFQRTSQYVAWPVGGMFNDFNGIIACGDLEQLDLASVMKQCGLKLAHFHALIDQGLTENRHSFARLVSPFVNLNDGLENYQQYLRKKTLSIRKQPQKCRRMERDLGPMRIEFDVREESVLEQAITWKREKFRSTRTFDILSVDWTANLLREVFRTRDVGFRGILNGMWAGDELVAAHFGFVSGSILHYWIPAFNQKHSLYSPGTQLLLGLIDQCEANAVSQIDLSFGPSPLKDRFANDRQFIEACCITEDFVWAFAARTQYQMRQAIRKTPFKESIKRVVRPLLPKLGGKRFR